MPFIQLHSDILYEIVGEVASIDDKDHRCLLNLSLTSRILLHATRPIIFTKIKWPHQNQHDEVSGLLFPPEALWPYIKTFHLDWPEHWPDLSPPLWGTKGTFGHTGSKGVYHPEHLDKLELALPKMNGIHTFQITCPFYPPTSLLTALVGCPNIKNLKVIDTPLNTDVIPVQIPSDFNLESFSLMAAGEALRVGEGPFNPKYRNIAYFSREYRRKTFTNVHGRFASIRYLFQLTRANNLRYLQLSGGSFTLLDLEEREWPNLNTLILTGIPFVGGIAQLVLTRMPKLFDLRLLFAKTNRHQAFEILPPSFSESKLHLQNDDRSKQVFSQITHLAVSNACNLRNTFQHVPNLERLVISAIAEYPRMPIACSMSEITRVLDDIILGGGNTHLTQVRLIMEDEIPISLFKKLGDNYPLLEFVEVELCRYQEIPSAVDADWSEISDAFSGLQYLRELRIAIPRVGCNLLCTDSFNSNPAHLQVGECVRANRKICATYLAARLPSLQKVGLQYRTRTGDYRSENRWLDYKIERVDDDDGTPSGRIRLHELGQTWYPFPEVWEAVPFGE